MATRVNPLVAQMAAHRTGHRGRMQQADATRLARGTEEWNKYLTMAEASGMPLGLYMQYTQDQFQNISNLMNPEDYTAILMQDQAQRPVTPFEQSFASTIAASRDSATREGTDSSIGTTAQTPFNRFLRRDNGAPLPQIDDFGKYVDPYVPVEAAGRSSVPGMEAYDKATNGQDPHHQAVVGEGEGVVNHVAMQQPGVAELIAKLNDQFPNPAAQLAPKNIPAMADGYSVGPDYRPPAQVTPEGYTQTYPTVREQVMIGQPTPYDNMTPEQQILFLEEERRKQEWQASQPKPSAYPQSAGVGTGGGGGAVFADGYSLQPGGYRQKLDEAEANRFRGIAPTPAPVSGGYAEPVRDTVNSNVQEAMPNRGTPDGTYMDPRRPVDNMAQVGDWQLVKYEAIKDNPAWEIDPDRPEPWGDGVIWARQGAGKAPIVQNESYMISGGGGQVNPPVDPPVKQEENKVDPPVDPPVEEQKGYPNPELNYDMPEGSGWKGIIPNLEENLGNLAKAAPGVMQMTGLDNFVALYNQDAIPASADDARLALDWAKFVHDQQMDEQNFSLDQFKAGELQQYHQGMVANAAAGLVQDDIQNQRKYNYEEYTAVLEPLMSLQMAALENKGTDIPASAIEELSNRLGPEHQVEVRYVPNDKGYIPFVRYGDNRAGDVIVDSTAFQGMNAREQSAYTPYVYVDGKFIMTPGETTSAGYDPDAWLEANGIGTDE